MVIRYTKLKTVYFVFSLILIGASVFCIFRYGLKLGIDFTGGTILEVSYKGERPQNPEIREVLKDVDLGSFVIQPTEEKGVIFRIKEISEETHQVILQKLGDVEEKRFEVIGPSIGKELANKTKLVVILALLLMILYIAIAFRKVSRPVKSWQYGLTSLVALLHDILIPLGVFAYLKIEISIPVITSLLTVLGYSINNVVVVFDRIRENIFKGGGTFSEIIDKSLNQTLARQLNTSLTTLFALVAIFLFGGATLKDFSLALILGIVSGMYSAFFIAAPMLGLWVKRK